MLTVRQHAHGSQFYRGDKITRLKYLTQLPRIDQHRRRDSSRVSRHMTSPRRTPRGKRRALPRDSSRGEEDR
jgi:hypothetical protein